MNKTIESILYSCIGIPLALFLSSIGIIGEIVDLFDKTEYKRLRKRILRYKVELRNLFSFFFFYSISTMPYYMLKSRINRNRVRKELLEMLHRHNIFTSTI